MLFKIGFFICSMVYSTYIKRRIIKLHTSDHLKPSAIRDKLLKDESISTTRQGIAKFLKRFRFRKTLLRKPGSGRWSMMTKEVRCLVKQQMRLDDETTAHQLHSLLSDNGFSLSLRIILRCRTTLGWTFRGSSYCQLIRDVNKVLHWMMHVIIHIYAIPGLLAGHFAPLKSSFAL